MYVYNFHHLEHYDNELLQMSGGTKHYDVHVINEYIRILVYV